MASDLLIGDDIKPFGGWKATHQTDPQNNQVYPRVVIPFGLKLGVYIT